MPTSTDNTPQGPAEDDCRRAPAEPRHTSFEVTDDPLIALWCANKILSEIRKIEPACAINGNDYGTELEEQFGVIVQKALDAFSPYSGAHMFWSKREKPRVEVMPQPKNAKDPHVQRVNSIIFQLNRSRDSEGRSRYSTSRLLQKLVQLSVGRSHVFTILTAAHGADLAIHPLKLCATMPHSAWTIAIPFSQEGANGVRSLCRELREAAADPACTDNQIASLIEARIDRWVSDIVWPDDQFKQTFDDTDRQFVTCSNTFIEPKEDFSVIYPVACRHVALISLFCENNGFGSMSYILAPTLHGEIPSSMVVYWPLAINTIGQVPLDLLYLLQFVLAQNATAILDIEHGLKQARELATARKTAIRHLGHTLKNRLDGITAFISAQGNESMISHTRMLTDLTVVLQLNGIDELQELLKLDPSKRDRFLDDESKPPLDLVAKLRSEWSALVEGDREYVTEGGKIIARCQLHVFPHIKNAFVATSLEDSAGTKYRITEAIYRELFIELLINVKRYGYSEVVPAKAADSKPTVHVSLEIGSADISGRKALMLFNLVEPEKPLPLYLCANAWTRWPVDRSFDGPAMSIQLLRRLGIGDLYFQTRDVDEKTRYFYVAIVLPGLEVHSA